MSNGTNKNVQVNWPNLLLLAAVAGNLFWLQSPLKSSRPSEKESAGIFHRGDQDAEARLWQDPFEAVRAYQEKPKLRADGTVVTNLELHDLARLRGQIQARLDGTNASLTLLPIMITGSPYEEGQEWRLRSRYAALSALQRAGYIPEDRDHVGYAIVPWPAASEALTNRLDDRVANLGSVLLSIPFEWFETNALAVPSAQAGDHILLLWLKDEYFEDKPLARLTQLITTLTQPAPSESNQLSSAAISVKIIGPWSSSTLQAMLTEKTVPSSGESKVDAAVRPLKAIEMFSASATAADALLLESNAPIILSPMIGVHVPRQTVKGILETKGIEFHNAICTDDQLCGALVRELNRRGVDFMGTRDRVALISEWDTTYGRSLPEIFYRAAINLYPNTNLVHTISRFSYLRGVDGKLPGAGTSSSPTFDNRASAASPGIHNRAAGLQRPEGRSQLDYVPRLVARLRRGGLGETNAQRGEIKAIGILGSDVYDKLLLLQSLHENFPQAIFFTTDLDARLFHPDQWQWSRNLIVASSFGLELNKELQKDVAPFRDNYQTAEYLACLTALGACTNDIARQLSPRLFEIGRRGAYDLSTTFTEIYPRRVDTRVRVFSIAFVETIAALFLAALLLYKVSRHTRAFFRFPYAALSGWLDKSKRRVASSSEERLARGACGILTVAMVGIVIGYVVLVCIEQTNPAGEPFSLFDGISIWPTELARMFTFCLCIVFFIKAWRDLETNSEELGRAFGPSGADRSGRTGRTQFEENSITEWVRADALKRGNEDDDEAEESEVSAAEAWAQYQRRGTFMNRCRRFVPLTIYYVLLAFVLTVLLGFPHIPYRGTLSLWLDHLALFLSVASLIFLIFFVVDATRLCARLIRFTRGKTDWGNAATVFSERVGMPKEYLDDWLDIHFITGRTRIVCRLIYYPFLILFIMIVSRTSYFDAWDWPQSLVIVLGMNSAFALYCAIYLRREAEKARKRAVENLNEKLCAVLGGRRDKRTSTDPETAAQNADRPASTAVARPDRAEQIRLLIRQIEANDEGAFAPLSRNPIVGALLMPFGGAGVLAFLDFITTH